jgi:hypothetical protein
MPREYSLEKTRNIGITHLRSLRASAGKLPTFRLTSLAQGAFIKILK